MKRTIALIYKSNQIRNLENPYFKAIMTIVGPAVTLSLLICAVIKVYPFGRLVATYRLLIVVVILFILFKLFSFAFKEDDLTKYEFTDTELKKATSYVKLCNAAMLVFVLIALVLIAVRYFNSLAL